MKIAEIRSIIDSANWARRDFQGHTSEEFLRAEVGIRMGAHIDRLSSLTIPARFALDLEARDSAIEYAQRMIDRWKELRAAAAPKPTLQLVSGVKSEAVAEADAHTSNVALPSYSELASVLAYLHQQASLGGLEKSNNALQKAAALLARIPSLPR